MRRPRCAAPSAGRARSRAWSSLRGTGTNSRNTPHEGLTAPLFGAEPVGEFANAVLDRRRRAITQNPAGARDIGASQLDISRLRRQVADARLLAQRRLELGDELAQLDRLGLAQVEDLERRVHLESANDPRDDVVDIRVIAAGMIVTPQRKYGSSH